MNPTPQDKLDDLINEIDADWSHDGRANLGHIEKAQAKTKSDIISLWSDERLREVLERLNEAVKPYDGNDKVSSLIYAELAKLEGE